jgi:hypothetical protein
MRPVRGRAATVFVGVGLLAAGGCGNRPLDLRDASRTRADGGMVADGAAAAGADGGARRGWTFVEAFERKVDILFVVDDSNGMMPLQQKLISNFPVFTQVLEGLPQGLPDVHIGVISTNLGAGRFELPGCPLGGDRGALQARPRGPCTASGLDPGQTFIADGGGRRNYSGTIEDVFACIAPLGQDGCGFEHPLAAVARALGADGAPPPPENAGFLRANALLSIIVIAKQDDCSAPPDSTLFDPSSRLASDPLGPLTPFRCNEYGHLCDGAPPPRTHAAAFADGACVPAEANGRLTPVGDFARQLKSVKADPSRVLVAVVAGLPDPYGVDMVAPGIAGDPSQWPSVEHACLESSGEFADPGVRLGAFAGGFGRTGVHLTICAPSFAPALQQVAQMVGTTTGPFCVDARLRLFQGQPDCTAVEQHIDENGQAIDSTAIPACADTGDVPPCWRLFDGNAMNCPGARNLAVLPRAGPPPTAGTTITLSCAIASD